MVMEISFVTSNQEKVKAVERSLAYAVQQFERRGDNFEIACERKDIVHPEAWSDLWQVIYLKKYGKMLCELSAQELLEYTEQSETSGSLQQFVRWLVQTY